MKKIKSIMNKVESIDVVLITALLLYGSFLIFALSKLII
jgi:hypothetical protein